MFKQLCDITAKPAAFSIYTADKLWTSPHLAKQMLQFHLDQNSPLASRPLPAIERVVDWIDEKFSLKDKRVCDLGCGPGLYAEKYAQKGAITHGLDFSQNSINYAERLAAQKSLSINYQVANYLTDPLPLQQDLVTLIYCDLCALSSAQRKQLYQQVKTSLKPQGHFVFDVFSMQAFAKFAEQQFFAENYMYGFWSEHKYYGFHHAFRYEEESVTLDHYTIVEQHHTWQVYNWLQYFTQQSISKELAENGFDVIEIVDSFDSDEANTGSFGVIARVR